MNKLDIDYQNLLQDILENGTQKETRNGGTLSVFGRQIRHKMSDGFPLLTTKKLPFKTIATELLWFLRGGTNVKYLVDNNCNIWNGDCFSNYIKEFRRTCPKCPEITQEEFIKKLKTDDEFANKWGELGPIYGKQWRSWNGVDKQTFFNSDNLDEKNKDARHGIFFKENKIDQMVNLINELKSNPDSRRLMVSAWNVGELDQMTLPPCHYGFQVSTRELTWDEQCRWVMKNTDVELENLYIVEEIFKNTTPKRAISLMWNQRSVDTFLGLPFNIASYGLLLELIAKVVNMIPDELIGNLGDVHLYSNHIEQAKEQFGRKLTDKERYNVWFFNNYETGMERHFDPDELPDYNNDYYNATPTHTRQPYALPKLNINTEFWITESGECGIGPIDANATFKGFQNENFCKCLLENDIQLYNYEYHPAIKAPLSN